jgi:hypothetical protein
MQTFPDSVPPAKIVHVRFYGQEVDNTGADADRRDEAPFSAKAYRTPLTRTFAAFSAAP